jgi:hypothetical protein
VGDDRRLVRTIPSRSLAHARHVLTFHTTPTPTPTPTPTQDGVLWHHRDRTRMHRPHCTNRYRSRLCSSRAQTTYHPFLLCDGQNPACRPLLRLLAGSGWAAPHALARATGKLMAEWRDRENASAGAGAAGAGSKRAVSAGDAQGKWDGGWAFFNALAGWTLEDKYRCEGFVVRSFARSPSFFHSPVCVCVRGSDSFSLVGGPFRRRTGRCGKWRTGTTSRRSTSPPPPKGGANSNRS